MVVEWDPPLQHRRGSPNRLLGIDIYYDFEWFDVFPNARAQFKNGKSMAHLIRDGCPEGKTPALLLTVRDDANEGLVESETHHVVAVKIRRYLERATGDAAFSYFGHDLDSTGMGIAELRTLAARPEVVRTVVERELGPEHIVEWAQGNADRVAQLRNIAGVGDGTAVRADLPTVLATLQAMDGIDQEVATALVGLLGQDLDKDVRLRLLHALTEDATGRYATTEVLRGRIYDRLGDARVVTQQYAVLLAEDAGETALQAFIETSPWLLGMDYLRVRERKALPRGTMDFILERYDGFHDVLELKSPQDDIIVAPAAVDGVPPPANDYRLSPALANALAQAHVYRDILTTGADVARNEYGLVNSRDPRLIIVIGQAKPLPDHRARVLRELNLSLHRVEIVPYDVLADRANTTLDNIERYLTASTAPGLAT